MPVPDKRKNADKNAARGSVYFEAACAREREGDLKGAIEELDRARENGFDELRARKNIGRLYRDCREYDLSIEELSGLAAAAPEDGEINAEIGRAYEMKKEYVRALSEFEEAFRKGYRTGQMLKDMARLYYDAGKYDSAVKVLGGMVERNEADAQVYAELGRNCLRKGDTGRAADFLKKAMGAGLKEEWIENALKSCLYYEMASVSGGKSMRSIDYAAARTKYGPRMENIGKKKEKRESDHMMLGRLYRECGMQSEAIEEFTEAGNMIKGRRDRVYENMVLNEIEITERKTKLESMPRSLGVTITDRCNLDCIMCDYREAGWELPKKTADEILFLLPYLRSILWQGGEVFLARDFECLFDAAAMHPGLIQSVVSSGILIDDKWAEKLVRAGVDLTLSIDGVTSETYEKIRRPAKFAALLENITRLNHYRKEAASRTDSASRKPTLSMHFVVMRSNHCEMEKALDFAAEHGFDTLKFSPVEGISGAENIFLNNDVRAEEHISRVRPRILKKAAEYGIHISYCLPCAGEPGGGAERREPAPAPRYSPVLCYLPWQSMYIDYHRNVKPQCLCPVYAGSIDSMSLLDIWNGPVMRSYREKILNRCPDWCDYKCITGMKEYEEFKVDEYPL
ncbi:MAG: radical SAM protein [Elusimicrobia bacterium]|nr:radical SAM protein [Elusimicrobiota bacterium]